MNVAWGINLTPSTAFKLLESVQELGLGSKSADFQTYALSIGLLKFALFRAFVLAC